MKKMIISLLTIPLLIVSLNTTAQVAINKDGSDPGSGAILHIKGDNGGSPVEAMFIKSSNGYIGIGTDSPDSKLHVAGNIKMIDGNQGAGKLLASDSGGSAGWQSLGTVFGNKFTGDHDFSCLSVISTVGAGIGTNNPLAHIHIEDIGDAKIIIDADAEDIGEDGNPRLELSQDGGSVSGALGFTGAAGSIYTGSGMNAMYLVNEYSSSFHLGTGVLLMPQLMMMKSLG